MENNEQKKGFAKFWEGLYQLRSVLLAFPVAVGAAALAAYSYVKLPDTVVLTFATSGEYAQTVSKLVAAFGPLAITALCLLLMFFSRKVLYPWLISLFSLVLPLVILLTNMFPG